MKNLEELTRFVKHDQQELIKTGKYHDIYITNQRINKIYYIPEFIISLVVYHIANTLP